MALPPDQIEKLEMFLSTDAWNKVLKPWMQSRGKALIEVLLEAPSNRPKPYDIPSQDDVLRGQIKECQFWLTAAENEVNVARHNRRLDESERQALGPGADNPPPNV